jgi:hypothetical protein
MRQALPCPVCDEVIDMDRLIVGQKVMCPCHENFIIQQLRPLRLRYAAYGEDQTDDSEAYAR